MSVVSIVGGVFFFLCCVVEILSAGSLFRYYMILVCGRVVVVIDVSISNVNDG